MDIIVRNKKNIRNKQLDDYYFKGKTLFFDVFPTGVDDYDFLIFIHAAIEEYLSRKHGIKEHDITAFDKKHINSKEPGDIIGCIYGKEHRFAENIERLICHELGIPWKKYEQALKKL